MDDLARKVCQRLAMVAAGQDNLEFITPKAAHLPQLADGALQALHHDLQQGIARRVAQRIVGMLEPVEVEQEDRGGRGCRSGRN